MKFKKLIFSLWLTLFTPGILTASPKTKPVILNFQDRAPFAGVLIPEYEYREMGEDILMTDSYKRDLSLCLESSESKDSNSFFFFGSGLAVGMFTAILGYSVFK